MTVKDIDYGYNKIKKELLKLKSKPFVKNGILEGPGSKLYEDGLKIVDVAKINEFGAVSSKGVVIPSRPFLRQSFDKNKNTYIRIINKGYDDIYSGGKTVKSVLDRVGLQMETDTKKEIQAGEFKPNSPSTIKNKKSSRPLVDTGQLINSIVSKTFIKGS